MKRSPGKRDESPSRPITFRAAEDLGPFELAQLWADRTAWPLDDRTQYDELSELAVMSALGKWLRLWQPMAIHSAMLAGARPEAAAGRSATACKSPSIAGTSGRFGSETSSSVVSQVLPRRNMTRLSAASRHWASSRQRSDTTSSPAIVAAATDGSR